MRSLGFRRRGHRIVTAIQAAVEAVRRASASGGGTA
jgi:hypothetical protein